MYKIRKRFTKLVEIVFNRHNKSNKNQSIEFIISNVCYLYCNV